MRSWAPRVVVVFLMLTLVPRPAHAYLDPGTGSMLLSAVISVVVTTGLALQAYGYRLLGLLRRRGAAPADIDATPLDERTDRDAPGQRGEESAP